MNKISHKLGLLFFSWILIFEIIYSIFYLQALLIPEFPRNFQSLRQGEKATAMFLRKILIKQR